MSDSRNELHDRGDEEVDALVRATDQDAVQALRSRLDIEGRLAQVLARSAEERAQAERLLGTEEPDDAQLRAVLASWSVELTAAGVRAPGDKRRVVRAVEDRDFFAAAVGRPHQGLEPWPDVVLEVAADGTRLAALLSLPSRPAPGVRVVAVARRGGWTARQDFVRARAEGILPDDGAGAADQWPVDLIAQLQLPPGEAGTADQWVVDLAVVRTDEC